MMPVRKKVEKKSMRYPYDGKANNLKKKQNVAPALLMISIPYAAAAPDVSVACSSYGKVGTDRQL